MARQETTMEQPDERSDQAQPNQGRDEAGRHGGSSSSDLITAGLYLHASSQLNLMPHAIARGVTLALENHGGGVTTTADELLRIVRAVKGANFGVNLDTGN
ncbi:MAG: sugar phosphate isomerase/epimerase family protein, partial [Isosphaeraceae bacterium]